MDPVLNKGCYTSRGVFNFLPVSDYCFCLLIVQNTNRGYLVRGFISKISIIHNHSVNHTIVQPFMYHSPAAIRSSQNRHGVYPASALYLTVQILTPALRTSSKVTTPTRAQVREPSLASPMKKIVFTHTHSLSESQHDAEPPI